MDADQIRKMNATYDGSVNSEYANIGGNRKETFNIRRNRHYGFMVARGPIEDPKCEKCNNSIVGAGVIINGSRFHNSCFSSN